MSLTSGARGLQSLASGMSFNLGMTRGLAATACEFDEPFILDTGNTGPARELPAPGRGTVSGKR
jgi:hypothetical protein